MATRVERRIVLNRSISLLAGIGAALLSGHEAQAQQLPEPADAPLTVPLVVPSTATASPNPPIPRRPSAIAPFERQLSAAPAAGQPTTISAGRTPTTFSVGNSGAASYSIPVWTPPGVGSVQLTLALSYSSRSRDGLLGVGWSLAGLSTITRCNRTWAQDGAPQGITLTTSDRLCLDGQQLKVVTGTPATPAQGGTTFATEIESFSQITAAGSSGSAPTSLTVTTKNGLIYDYGLTVDSQILAGPNGPIRTWALSQIRDRVGNKIKFSYYNDAESGSGYTDGSYRVKEIDYPYTASGQGPFYSVTFAYSARPSGANTPGGYIAGSLVTEPNELTTVSIQNYGSSTPTKVYYLTYSTNSVSSRLQLQQVQECSASNCLPATTIAYQAGAQGWSGSALSAGVQSSTQASPIAIDLNGDGLTDLLYPVTVNSSSVHWWIVFSTGSGFGSPVDTGITTGNFPTIIIGAFSGSGQNQVFVGQSGYWYVYTCNTSGCTAANTNVPVNGEMFAADYDGDGLPDLVSAVGNSVLVRR
ncbi:MAG TPA: SpvB/TcaC N-terminal domain-containing protein, partial [Terriglobales bacterium]|nr:SpvB/TcaC N-terminal domain-containing protein [Terriglobales bacterium]